MRKSGELTDSNDNHEMACRKQPKVECEEEEDKLPAKKFRTDDVRFRQPRDDLDQSGMDQSTSSNQSNQEQNIKQDNPKKRGKRGGKNRGWKDKKEKGNGQQIQQPQQENPKNRRNRGGKNRGWKGHKSGGGTFTSTLQFNSIMEIDGENAVKESPLVIGRTKGVKKLLTVAADCFKQDPSESLDPSSRRAPLQLTIPGARIGSAAGLMRGHGTFLDGDSLYSSLAGVVVQTNKLIRVRPINSRYQGEVGDVVVGRILEVQQKRWRVDINSRLNSVLLLTSVNLPGGELRRKSIEDELLMRGYLQEGDLVSAEVQQCFHDGALSLQTRSLKYGKLGQGQLVKVFPHLVRRRKTHFHQLPFGAAIILGCNGYIWVSRHKTEEEQRTGGYIADTVEASVEQRDTIARTANCIKLLARNSIPLYEDTINIACNSSLRYPTKMLIRPEIADAVAEHVIAQCMANAIDDGDISVQI